MQLANDMERHLAMHRLSDALGEQMKGLAGCVNDAFELDLKDELFAVSQALEAFHAKLAERHHQHIYRSCKCPAAPGTACPLTDEECKARCAHG